MDTKNPFRFSLRTLLLGVVAVSVGTAAMVSAVEWWQATIMTATGALMVLAVLLAAFRTGASRAFWTGFAVCGSAYLLTLIVQIDNQRVADQLLPGKLLHLAVERLHAMPGGPYAPVAVTPSYSVPAYAPPSSAMPVPSYSTSPAIGEPTSPTPIAPGPADDPIPPAETTKPVDSSGCGADEDTPTTEEPTIDVPLSPPLFPPISNNNLGAVPGVLSAAPVTYYSTPYGFPVPADVFARQYRAVTIGHCLWAILFGVIGGWFSMWLYATRNRTGA